LRKLLLRKVSHRKKRGRCLHRLWRRVSPIARGPPWLSGHLQSQLFAFEDVLLLLQEPTWVDDILGEGSDDSDSEKRKPEDQDNEQERAPKPRKPRTPGIQREQPLGLSSSGERSTAGMRGPRGHKRKLNEEDAASESSGESSNEDEEGSSSEADEMAAALEAELNDLMPSYLGLKMSVLDLNIFSGQCLTLV
ncbi:hypothetical protein A6R68_17462, partial [Neotoma lepida]